jgi:WD40 repeat protein
LRRLSLQKQFANPGIHVRDTAGKSTKLGIRIGIHSTLEVVNPEPSFDDWAGWDYKGQGVSIVCRVGGVGDQGQIFVSDQAHSQFEASHLFKWNNWRTHLKGFGFAKVWECMWDGRSRGAPQRKQRRQILNGVIVLFALVTVGFWYRFQSLQEAHKRRLETVVTSGLRSMEAGDFSLAALWFVEALRLDEGDPSKELVHRLRIGAAMREHPELVRTWFLDGGDVMPNNGRYAGFSPDGQKLITCARGAQVWNIADGKPSAPLLDESNVVVSAVFSPDGDRILTASKSDNAPDGFARLWNAKTGQPLTLAMKHPRNVFEFYCTFNPDAALVATVAGDVAQLWDAGTGNQLHLALQVGNTSGRPQFSQNGKWLATPNAIGDVKVWAVPSGQLIASLPHAAATIASFSPDSRRIVVGGFNSYRIWETQNWTPITAEIPMGAIEEAMFSPDGKKLVISGHGIAFLCSAETPGTVAAELRFQGWATCTAFSPDSSLVAISSEVSMANKGEVSLWDARTGRPRTQPLKEEAAVKYLEFSKDSSMLLSASFDKSSDDDKVSNGVYPISNTSRVRLWRLPRSASEIARTGLPSREILKNTEAKTNGALIVTAENNWVYIHDLTSGRLIAKLEHRDTVNQTQLSKDGKLIATARYEGMPPRSEVRVWEAKTGEPVSPVLPQDSVVGSLEFSPDGSRLLVACGHLSERTGAARVWDARSGQPLTPPMQLGNYLQFAGFNSNGTLLVTTGFKAARVWDAMTGLPVTSLLPHPNCFVTNAKFDPDGSHLLTTCGDAEGRKWDISPDHRSIAFLVYYAQALSGRKIDSVGAPVVLSRREFQRVSESSR